MISKLETLKQAAVSSRLKTQQQSKRQTGSVMGQILIQKVEIKTENSFHDEK